jgi:hypothetical protein
MTRYLVAIHHADDYAPSLEDEAMVRDIDVLNEEMEAANARFLAGGLQSAPAKSLRKQPGGEVVITDGPYLETKEHIGGFWILECADIDVALAGRRRAPSPARCASFFSTLLRNKKPAKGSKTTWPLRPRNTRPRA